MFLYKIERNLLGDSGDSGAFLRTGMQALARIRRSSGYLVALPAGASRRRAAAVSLRLRRQLQSDALLPPE